MDRPRRVGPTSPSLGNTRFRAGKTAHRPLVTSTDRDAEGPENARGILDGTMTFDDVHALAMGLPGVSVTTKWGNRTWTVNGRMFAWQRPFSHADVERFGDKEPPAGEILAVRVESLDAKDALLAIAPRGFFTIPHLDGYPAILIALEQARAADVRAAVRDAFAATSRERPARRRRS